MSDLKALRSKTIAGLHEIINDLEIKLINTERERDSAKSRADALENDIAAMAADAAQRVWQKERSILLSKIDRLEKEKRDARRNLATGKKKAEQKP